MNYVPVFVLSGAEAIVIVLLFCCPSFQSHLEAAISTYVLSLGTQKISL